MEKGEKRAGFNLPVATFRVVRKNFIGPWKKMVQLCHPSLAIAKWNLDRRWHTKKKCEDMSKEAKKKIDGNETISLVYRTVARVIFFFIVFMRLDAGRESLWLAMGRVVCSVTNKNTRFYGTFNLC